MSAVFDPLILCDTCGSSMHDGWATVPAVQGVRVVRTRELHEAKCHSSSTPGAYSYPTAEAVEAAGWTREDFTHWPYLSAEDAFWEAHYAASKGRAT